MADNRFEYGFRWDVAANGKSCPQPIEMFVADAYQATGDGGSPNVDLNAGDPVKLVSDGSVALANTTEDVYGILVAVYRVFDSASGNVKPVNRVPGGTTGSGNLERQTRVGVVPASWGIWALQVDDKTTATTEAAYQAFIGENVNHVCAGDTTDANRPKANPRMDISSHATTAGLTWRIVGISKNVSNQFFDESNVTMLTRVNKGQEAGWPATTITGV